MEAEDRLPTNESEQAMKKCLLCRMPSDTDICGPCCVHYGNRLEEVMSALERAYGRAITIEANSPRMWSHYELHLTAIRSGVDASERALEGARRRLDAVPDDTQPTSAIRECARENCILPATEGIYCQEHAREARKFGGER
jgi:hypothetical protein